MKYIIKITTTTSFGKETSFIRLPRKTFVCGTFDLLSTSIKDFAFRFKSQKTAQKFIDSVSDQIETYDTLSIVEVEQWTSSNYENI